MHKTSRIIPNNIIKPKGEFIIATIVHIHQTAVINNNNINHK